MNTSISTGSRALNGLQDCLVAQDYPGPQDSYGNGNQMAAVMAAVAALTGNAVPMDAHHHQQKQYQLMQLQAAAQQLQNMQNMQHAAMLQQQQSQAAAAAIFAAASQQQQQQLLPPAHMYGSRPPAPLPLSQQMSMPLSSATMATSSPTTLPPQGGGGGGALPFMSLTNADYEDSEQTSEESEESDDAKSRCLLRNGSGGNTQAASTPAAAAAAAAAPSTLPASDEKESSPEPAAPAVATAAPAPREDLKMLVDVVSENDKGCQVWMDPIRSTIPAQLALCRNMKSEPPAALRKRKGSLIDNGSGGSSSGGSETIVEHAGTGSKRMRLVWTPELHGRFLHAVNQLGVSSAVPKTILQMINVGGMTRENVASHLQKYRLYLKRLAGLPASAPLRTSETLRQLQTAQQVAAAAGSGGVANVVLTTAELISQLEAMNSRGHHTHRAHNHTSAAAMAAAAAAAAASLLPPSIRPPALAPGGLSLPMGLHGSPRVDLAFAAPMVGGGSLPAVSAHGVSGLLGAPLHPHQQQQSHHHLGGYHHGLGGGLSGLSGAHARPMMHMG